MKRFTKSNSAMFHVLRNVPSHFRFSQLQGIKRQLSTAKGKADAQNSFAWRLICLGGLSCGFYFAFSATVKHRYAEEEKKKKKVVLLGSGWAAVNFIRHLKPELYDVSVVSLSNYFLFTPLLPSVTVGTVEIRSVVEPIRNLIHKKHKTTVKFYEGECIDVDVEKQTIHCKDSSGELRKDQEVHVCCFEQYP